MAVLPGLVILVVLLWAAQRSRTSRFLNIPQQRLSGTLALVVAAVLTVRGDWGLGLALPWPLGSRAAYLDGGGPGGREHAQADADTGSGARATAGSKMTEQEAYQVLGVERGASVGEITHAHRSVMKKVHPDQGGTTYLAARINEAKDVLLRSHR